MTCMDSQILRCKHMGIVVVTGYLTLVEIKCSECTAEGITAMLEWCCAEECGYERRKKMKNGKKPTREHRGIMKKHGLNPDSWLVVKNLPDSILVVSRISLHSGKKPDYKILPRM